MRSAALWQVIDWAGIVTLWGLAAMVWVILVVATVAAVCELRKTYFSKRPEHLR